ncbi:STAS-like domain-containing protein [Enterococcus faecalis]
MERSREVRVGFAGVEEVGQGFVDEVFHVWPSQNPRRQSCPSAWPAR